MSALFSAEAERWWVEAQRRLDQSAVERIATRIGAAIGREGRPGSFIVELGGDPGLRGLLLMPGEQEAVMTFAVIDRSLVMLTVYEPGATPGEPAEQVARAGRALDAVRRNDGDPGRLPLPSRSMRWTWR